MKALRFVLLGLAVAVTFGWAWRLVDPGFFGLLDGPTPAQQTAVKPDTEVGSARAAVLSRLADVATYAPFFDRLKAEFPGDYKNLIDGATAVVEKGGRVPNPERLLTSAVRTLRQSHGILAAQADAQPLVNLFVAQSAMVDALAAVDPSMCTDFIYGGASPNFMAFVATHRDLLERLAVATLAAIASGQTTRIERATPTGADFNALSDALKAKNLSDDEIAALLDGKTFDPPLPDARLCQAGSTYLHILQGMPEDLRLRVYALSAQMLARS